MHVPQGVADAEGGAAELQSPGFDLGQVENVIDELEQMSTAIENVVRVLELAVVQVAKRLVHEYLGKADDGVQRRAQLVAHVGEELALGAIGCFRRVLGLLQGLLGLFAPRDVREDAVGAHLALTSAGRERPAVQPDPFLVLPSESVLNVELFLLCEQQLIGLIDVGDVVWVNAIQPQIAAGADHLLRCVTKDLLHIAADVSQLPFGVGRPDHIRNVRHQGTVFCLARPHGVLGFHAMCDVLNHRLELECVGLVAEETAHGALMPDHAVVRREDLVVERHHGLLQR